MTAFAQLLHELKPDHVAWSRLAQGLDVTPSYMSLLASGRRRPSREQVEQIASQMGTSKDGLLAAAGYVPEELLAIMARHPQEARKALLELDRQLAVPRASNTLAGPAPITTESVEGRLQWKATLRKALLPHLRELDPHFKAPWNTSRHQVIVLPRYRIYQAKLFFAWFEPVEQMLRFGFWVEKGIERGAHRDPEWRMTQTWDWHRFIDRLGSGEIEVGDFALAVDGVEARASGWGPHDVRWTLGRGGKLRRIENGAAGQVMFKDVLATLREWPEDQWCDFFVSASLPVADAVADPPSTADRMMKVYRALYPLLRMTAEWEGA